MFIFLGLNLIMKSFPLRVHREAMVKVNGETARFVRNGTGEKVFFH